MLGRIRRSASFGRRGSSSSDRAPRLERRNPINDKTHQCCARAPKQRLPDVSNPWVKAAASLPPVGTNIRDAPSETTRRGHSRAT